MELIWNGMGLVCDWYHSGGVCTYFAPSERGRFFSERWGEGIIDGCAVVPRIVLGIERVGKGKHAPWYAIRG